METRQVFHIISYLQYPLLLVVLYYYALFIVSLTNQAPKWIELNNALVFLGMAIAISTLQDTTRTQNKLSRKIWEDPKKGKIAILIMTFMVLLFLAMGIIGFLNSRESIHKEVSFGLVVLGIGLVGMLKSAIEMFENHRKDKNAANG